MPVIRISENSWARLKEFAEPLEDSVDDALARVLDFAESNPEYSGRKRGSIEGVGALSDDTGLPHTVTERAPAGLPPSIRRRKGQKVPQSAYERHILEALDELGGKAKVSDVLDELKQRMDHLFTSVDYEKTGPEIRWRNTARWARAALVQQGLIEPRSKRGIWELTRRGRVEVGKMIDATL